MATNVTLLGAIRDEHIRSISTAKALDLLRLLVFDDGAWMPAEHYVNLLWPDAEPARGSRPWIRPGVRAEVCRACRSAVDPLALYRDAAALLAPVVGFDRWCGLLTVRGNLSPDRCGACQRGPVMHRAPC